MFKKKHTHMGSKVSENLCKITNFKKNPWEELIRKQQITFYDENNNVSVFTIKVFNMTSMIRLKTKISRILMCHRRILNLCFGKDISDIICKFLPSPKIDYCRSNFYTYKDAINPYTMKVYKIKNIISNSDYLFEVVRDHRYETDELNMNITAKLY